MKKNLLLLTLLFLFISVPCFPQLNQQWLVRYSNPLNTSDHIRAIKVDSAGNVYAAGMTYSISTGANDFLIAKYNSSGVEQWVKTYTGPAGQDDYANDIDIDNNGNVYVTGLSKYGAGAGQHYMTIVKYDPDGFIQWNVNYPGTFATAVPFKIIVKNGYVYIAGSSTDTANGNSLGDYMLVKYRDIGIFEWAKRYNGPANGEDIITDFVVDSLDNVFVTGYSAGTGAGADYVTIKYTSNGGQQWLHRYNNLQNFHDRSYAIAIDSDGNTFVTGTSYSGVGVGYECTTLKYTYFGDLIWLRTYNGPANKNDTGNDIVVDGSGNAFITGFTTDNATGDMFTLKYDSAGNQGWIKNVTGPGTYNIGKIITLDNASNVYSAGFSNGASSFADFFLVKYSITGSEILTQRYNGTGNGQDTINDIYVHPSGSKVVVAGNSEGAGTQSDGVIIQYSQLTNTQNISTEIPSHFNLYQNYPNPFNPSTKIEFALPESGNVKLDVYDVSGRRIIELVNGTFNAGVHTVHFDAANISAGVYYYRIRYNGLTEVKKMMLLK